MKFLIAVLLTLAVALLSSPPGANAATFYVNNASGSSCSNTGAGTLAQPYCTITAALAAHHAAGTTIIVLPGTYKEQVNIPGSGASGSPLVLQGQGTPSNPVIVDGSNSSGTPTNSFNINVAGVSWVVIDGFTVTKSVWDGIYVSNSSNVTVTHNIATFGQHYGIEASNSTATTIGSNNVHDNTWSGIALTGGSTGCTIQDNESHHNITPNQSSGIYDYGSPGNLIQRNRTHDNAYNGIMNTTGAVGNVMRQNRSWNNQHQGLEDIFCTGNYHTGDVSYHNGWNGFAIEGGATGTTTFNCVAFDNGQSTGNTNFEVDAQSTSGNTSNDNLWWNSYGGTIIKFGGNNYSTVSSFAAATGKDTRTKQADPKFTSASGGDFRPLAGSPLIDCGNSGVANWPSTDAAGNARVDDPATANTGLGPVTFSDRGALEYLAGGGGGVNQPPVAALKLTPSSGIAPLAVTADGSGSTDPEGGRISTCRFDFGDGTVVGPQSGRTATHTYTSVGTWLATLTVTDSVGATGSASAPDTVRAPANRPPVAALKLTPSSGIAPLAVTADGTGSTDPEGGRIASYRFDFGDGTVVGPQSGKTATHTYSAVGTWLATLTVADSVGATGSASAPDTVRAPANRPPVAALKLTPSSGIVPLAVTADGTGSTDPEGGRIASYRFNFGDGTIVGPQSGKTATHTYTSVGTWLATLTVTDSIGATGSASAPDTVRAPGNRPPVAALKLTPSSGTVPLAVTADGTGSTDPEGGRIFTYRFDFGDGTVVGPQSGKTATHTYSAVGTWLATLTVTDSIGATGSASAPDTVRAPGNLPPVAALQLTPSSGLVPLPVTADASGSRDPEGGRIASYRFDFGDGTIVGPQAGATAAHTYTSVGTWLANVTVTDSIGATGSASARDTVTAVGNLPPVARLVATPALGIVPLPVTLDASTSTDPEGGRIASYQFNFGDGTVAPGPQATPTAAHTYTSVGKWLATVTVTDSAGATGTFSVYVNVTTAPAVGTYYVDGSSATCSPTGPGTLASPFCTITAALTAQHAPGTTIVVMPGVYREQVTVPAAGLVGNPLVLQGQGTPGNPVVLDGADDFANPTLWTLSAGTVWLAASVTWSPVQVFADSVRLAVSTAAPAALPANSFVYVAGQGLYVNLGGANPGDHHAEVGHRLYGVYVSGRTWVTIDGFTSTRSEAAGIELTNLSNNITATHNATVFSGGYGIQVNNVSACLVGANVASDNLKSGIGLTAAATGCTVQDNETFRNITPSQSCGIYNYGSPGNLIQRNSIHDNAYTGLKLIGGAINNVMVQNRSWRNAHYGFQDVSSTENAHVGDVANGNLAFGFDIENIATGTTMFDCVSTDNSGGNLQVDATSVTGFSSNDNLFWSLAGGTVVKFNGVSYPTVLAYSTATTQDTRTLQADPKFANAAAGDFHPLAGSPLIDNANSGVANWPATDGAGNARFDDPATANTGLGPVAFADRGAFEFGSGPALVAGAAALQSGTGGSTDDASLRFHGLAPSVSPNPLRTTASIAFRLDRPTTVRVRIFDLVGRLVRTVPAATATNVGWNVVALDGRTDEGAPLRSGIYMYEIRAGEQRAVGRFVVMR
jgi:parallel beta-helix repeat protein